MKIVRNTPDQLILHSVPWAITILLSVFFLAVIGLGLNALFQGDGQGAFWGLLAIPAFLAIFVAMFVRRDDLILDRSRNLLELRHSTVFGRRKIRHELHHLSQALVQSTRSENADTYRVALILDGGMDAGVHPVTEVYASGKGAERAADAINNWLSLDVDSPAPQA